MLHVFWILLFAGSLNAQGGWQTYSGSQEENARIQNLDIQDTDVGGRMITVNFHTSHPTQSVWYVNGNAVLNYDTRFATVSRGSSASLIVGSNDRDVFVVFSLLLPVVKTEVYIRLQGTESGHYEITNHTVEMNPKERVMYETTNGVHTDVGLWVDDASYRTRTNAMLIYVDYCSRPVKPEFGFAGSALEMRTPRADDTFLGLFNWRLTYPMETSSVKRIAVSTVPRGLLRVTSGFSTRAAPISRVTYENTLLFRPENTPDVIDRNTVMFISWNKDIYADINSDVDFHIFAIGNPTPRIMLAKGRRDVSSMVERLDIEQAYYKETIFRIRNISEADAGRYLCTAASGSATLENSFVLYVRKPCSSS